MSSSFAAECTREKKREEEAAALLVAGKKQDEEARLAERELCAHQHQS